jgi:MFS family permease
MSRKSFDFRRNIRNVLHAFKYRNFRLFFIGQSISLIGTWMQNIAVGWLVYRLSHSPFYLGLTGFFSQIPTFFLFPFAGVLADRWNRHRIMMATQALSMVQAFTLAALVFSNRVSVWQLMGLSLFLGFLNAFDAPARQAFVFEMIEKKEDFANAIALNSLMFNGARLIGPFVAGMLIALTGEGVCFFINGLSYIAVIVALLSMSIEKRELEKKASGVWTSVKEGFHYVLHSSPIKAILLLIALTSIMGMPYAVLMPIFAKNVLKGGSHTLGFLMSAAGSGALLGALYLASRKSVAGLGRKIVAGTLVFGSSIIVFAMSHVLWISLPVLFIAGFGIMMQVASCNTVLQTIVDDDKRGRVMSFYTMALIGTIPFGSLIAGTLASHIGASHTLMIGGIACILSGVLFGSHLPHLRRMIMPIYMKMGIIPEAAVSIENEV